jgi:UDP-N-acetylmuramoyl-L-alanyl-D-glutamate--2,6-diaminopimelate ligase
MRTMFSVTFAKMVEAGLTHVVLETTSHGWSQHRVDACEFDIAVVTNITHEHMDEHGSYENYRAAKARLFTSLEWTREKPQGNPRLGVINFDDVKSFAFLNDHIKVNKINYGLGEGANVRGVDIQYSPSGIQFIAESKDFRVAASSSLVGAYNVSNCLAALTARCMAWELTRRLPRKGLPHWKVSQGVWNALIWGRISPPSWILRTRRMR